jgi:hypothetical protein
MLALRKQSEGSQPQTHVMGTLVTDDLISQLVRLCCLRPLILANETPSETARRYVLHCLRPASAVWRRPQYSVFPYLCTKRDLKYSSVQPEVYNSFNVLDLTKMTTREPGSWQSQSREMEANKERDSCHLANATYHREIMISSIFSRCENQGMLVLWVTNWHWHKDLQLPNTEFPPCHNMLRFQSTYEQVRKDIIKWFPRLCLSPIRQDGVLTNTEAKTSY